MSLDQFLKKRVVKKKVDPSIGPGLNNQGQIPSDIKSAEPDFTPANQRVEDLISYSDELINKANEIILEIYAANKTDQGFLDYFELVKANRFDPLILKDNPSFVPSRTSNINAIKAAERDVFNRLTDPRASFVWDLYNILDDISLSSLALQKIWRAIVAPNSLYSEFDYNSFIRAALLKEKQYLDLQNQHLDMMKNNTLKGLSSCYIKGLLESAVNKTLASSLNRGEAINQVLQKLRQVHTILQWGQYYHVENWETAKSVLGDVFGDFFRHVAHKLLKDSTYAVLGGVYDKVNEFSQDLNAFTIPFNSENFCLDTIEFNNQLEFVLKKQLERFEGDLLQKERNAIDLDESRAAAILVSQKNSKSKQMTLIVEELLSQFDLIKNQPDSVNLDYLESALLKKSNAYKNTVSIRQPGTPPFVAN